MRVLIGVDGSAGSLTAVRLVGRLLAAEKDEVIFYYSPPQMETRRELYAETAAKLLRSHITTIVFHESRSCLPEPLWPRVETIVGTRDPRDGLLIAADETRAGLIVVGARGAGPLKEASVGSLARYIVHHATMPVLVVRGGPHPPDDGFRVLLASDGTEVSHHASGALQRLSWPAGTTGQTITVIESARAQVPQWLIERLDDEQLAALGLGPFTQNESEHMRMRQEASRWYGTLPAIFNGQDPLVVVGHPGEQILKAIKANHIDLVVVGAHRQGPVRRLLLGSTSEHVLAHAACIVLIVRGHEKP